MAVLFGALTLYAKADTVLPPTNITATPLSPTQIQLNWTSATGTSYYEVYRTGTSTLHATTSATTFSDPGLTPNTLYTYYLASVDASSTRSDFSGAVSTTTLNDLSAPTVPTGLSATAVSNSQINLAWASSTDNIAVTGYRLYRDNVLRATVSSLTFSDTALAASTTYAYQVSAIDAAGNESARSATSSAMTSNDLSAPTVPTGLSATAVSNSQINLAWASSTDNIAVTGYRLYRDNVLRATVSSLTFSDTALAASTTYAYQVSAIDAAGNESARSATSSAMTLGTTPAPNPNINVQIKVYYGGANGKQVNLRSAGLVKIAVLSTADIDATKIIKKTAKLGGATARLMMNQDANRDGKKDKVLWFREREMKDLANTDTKAAFSANTTDGKSLYGEITVRVKNSKLKRIVKIEKKVAKLENKIVKLEEKKTSLQNQITKIETKINDLKNQASTTSSTVTTVVATSSHDSLRNVSRITEKTEEKLKKQEEAFAKQFEKMKEKIHSNNSQITKMFKNLNKGR